MAKKAPKQPDFILKINATDSYENEEGEKRTKSVTVGAAWQTEGGALYLKSEFDIAVPLSSIVLVPNKES